MNEEKEDFMEPALRLIEQTLEMNKKADEMLDKAGIPLSANDVEMRKLRSHQAELIDLYRAKKCDAHNLGNALELILKRMVALKKEHGR
jgi:hypothetical protein